MGGALAKSLRRGTGSLEEPVKNDIITSVDLTKAPWLGSFKITSSQEFAMVGKDKVEEGKN